MLIIPYMYAKVGGKGKKKKRDGVRREREGVKRERKRFVDAYH